MTMTAQQQHLWHQAEVHASRQDWTAAATTFGMLLEQRPSDGKLLLQLSYVESLAGHYRAAKDYALKAAGTKLNDATAIRELVSRLRTFNEAEQLRLFVERLQPLDQVPIPTLLACAAQFSYLGDQSRALLLLNEAKRGDPDYPPTLLARGQVLMYLGRFEEAESEVLKCLGQAPELAQGWWLLSRLRKQSESANHTDQIKAELQRPHRRPHDVAMLADALHKEMDDLGRYGEAWGALALCCKVKRSTLTYDVDDSRSLVAALTRLQNEVAVTFSSLEPVPVFIVGMHRSGTTLLEQLLDGHSDVHGVGELYDFTSQMRYATDHHCRGVIDLTIVERSKDVDFAAVGEGYLKGVEWRLGKERFFTDKLPSNFLNIGFICQALPQAKILHMVRDPIETCFSNLRELFSDANPYSYDQLELADFYKQYRRLMAHWHQAYPGRILDVDYAALTRDTETVLRQVSAFCGFAFEPEMLALQNRKRGVATASAVQVRDKVVVREQPKWKPYEQYLQPLIQALQADGFVQ